MLFYELSFRIVRFKLSHDSYETVITNLDYPPDELMRLYAMRWGIETSFRDLKYTIGLSAFHSKKWSTFSRKFSQDLPCTTSPNASSLAWSYIVATKKHAYQVNFSAAVHICRKFFVGMCIHPMLKLYLHGLFRLSAPTENKRVSSPRKALSASSTE